MQVSGTAGRMTRTRESQAGSRVGDRAPERTKVRAELRWWGLVRARRKAVREGRSAESSARRESQSRQPPCPAGGARRTGRLIPIVGLDTHRRERRCHRLAGSSVVVVAFGVRDELGPSPVRGLCSGATKTAKRRVNRSSEEPSSAANPVLRSSRVPPQPRKRSSGRRGLRVGGNRCAGRSHSRSDWPSRRKGLPSSSRCRARHGCRPR